jgi:hypothetical protein
MLPRLALVAMLVACGAAERAPATPELDARLSAMPPPPVAWSTPCATLSDADFEGICPYLAEHVGLGTEAVTCPDGSIHEPYLYECEPARSGAAARSLPCAITFGEMLACYLTIRDHACEHGRLGEGHPECDALAACGIDLPVGGER